MIRARLSKKMPQEGKEVRDVFGFGLLIYFEHRANRMCRQLESGARKEEKIKDESKTFEQKNEVPTY